MIWLALALLVLAAFIIVLPPLLKPSAARSTTNNTLAVYRDQLREIDADEARGVISPGEAEAARTEIKRRILAAADVPRPTHAASSTRWLPASLAIVIAGLSLGIYLSSGNPNLPAHPYNPAAEREAVAEGALNEINAMVANLAEKLKSRPNDAKGWRMLGWSYVQLGRIDEGVAALKHAVTLDAASGPLRSQLGEALVQQANGTVTPDAVAAFDEALKRDGKDPRARFYKGLAQLQAGKDREALDAWVALLREGPRDAEWYTGIQTQARGLAVKLKLDPAATVP